MSEFCSIFDEKDGFVDKCYRDAGAPVWQVHYFTNSYGVGRPLRVLTGIVSRYTTYRIEEDAINA